MVGALFAIGRGPPIDEILGELKEDLRLGFRGWPLDLRITGVQVLDSVGECRPNLLSRASAIDAERPWPPPVTLFCVPERCRGVPRLGLGGIIDDEADRIMGDGSTSLPLALAKDDVKWGNAPGGITAALRVGGSVAAGSGERRGKGTALSSSGLVYAADVSIESDFGSGGDALEALAQVGWGVGVGVKSGSSSPTLKTGPFSVEGLTLGLVEALSEEESSPTLNLARRSLLVLRSGGMTGSATIERGTDASGVDVVERAMAEGGAEGLTRRGRPRRGLCAPGPRSVEKLCIMLRFRRGTALWSGEERSPCVGRLKCGTSTAVKADEGGE